MSQIMRFQRKSLLYRPIKLQKSVFRSGRAVFRSGPDYGETRTFFKDEIARWAKMVEATGLSM